MLAFHESISVPKRSSMCFVFMNLFLCFDNLQSCIVQSCKYDIKRVYTRTRQRYMPWTKLHEFITSSELNDKVLKYINEDKYCHDEYWTLTPLHLSIMALNNTARVALLSKGVKETIFDYHLF